MTSMRLRGVSAVVVGIASLGVGVPAAGAGEWSPVSNAEILSSSASLFAGTVTAKEPKCEKGRTVNLLYAAGKHATVVGTDKTDADGNWEMPGNYSAGTYAAVVKAKTISARLGRRCKADRSEPVRY